jgi:hypothetical protein
VKCDRGQPSCGWCSRNGAICEYKERKKPGLRAGYGRELEQRLDRLEDVLRSHAQILESSFSNNRNSLSSDHETPQSVQSFRPNDGRHIPHAETALFLQKPSTFPPGTQSIDFSNSMAQTPVMQSMEGKFSTSRGCSSRRINIIGPTQYKLDKLPSFTARLNRRSNLPALTSPKPRLN